MQIQLDLFGEEHTSYDALWLQLENDDSLTRVPRYLRVQFVAVLSQGRTFMLPSEMSFLFREAKSTFINGEFTATILLVLAFIEHWLAPRAALRQNSKKATRAGISAIVDYLRSSGELPVFLIERIDQLREIRNPFVHLRPGDHNRIDLLSMSCGKSDYVVLELQAREALGLLFAVADWMPEPWPLQDSLRRERRKPWLDDPQWDVPGNIPASHFGMFAPLMIRRPADTIQRMDRID